MADPIVYGPAVSTYVRSVRLALEEKGVPYDLKEIDIFQGAQREPGFLALNPFGKVPAFEHDGFVLFETAAICRYVDEAFEGPALQPADVRIRARMAQINGIVTSYAYPSIITSIVIQRAVVPMLGGTPDEEMIRGALDQAGTCIATLDGFAGESAYLAGESISLADMLVAPVYHYLRGVPEAETLLASAGNLDGWWSRMEGRESMVKTVPNLG